MKRLTARQKRWMARIERLRDQDKTWPEIAQQLGLATTTLYDRYHRYHYRLLAEQAQQQADGHRPANSEAA